MDILSTVKNILSNIGYILVVGSKFIYYGTEKIGDWLLIHIPILQKISLRHKSHPATLFLDIALLILFCYLTLAAVSFVFIYPKRSEGNFALQSSALFPFPAARVETTFIWSHDFLQRVHFINSFNDYKSKNQEKVSGSQTQPPTDKELRERVLEGLIEDQIIISEAKKLNVSVSLDDINKTYENQKKSQCSDKQPDGTLKQRDCTDQEFEQIIKEIYDMNLTQFKTILGETILKEKVKNTLLTRIRVSHILISSETTTAEVKKKLDGGKNFGEATKEFSEDANTKESAGDLGYWTKGDGLDKKVAPAFEEAAFALNVNQISNPIKTQYGYHILTVTEKTGDQLKTFSDWVKEVSAKYKIRRFMPI